MLSANVYILIRVLTTHTFKVIVYKIGFTFAIV
jgi:hypothetical protein